MDSDILQLNNESVTSPLEIANIINGKNGFVLNGIRGQLIDSLTRSRLVIADISDNSGTSVSSAGDINGDGFDDVIIGAPFADPNLQLDALVGNQNGESYVVFGGFEVGNSGVIELSSLDGETGFVINGINNNDPFDGSKSGSSLSNIGDINGDNFDDIIIGSPGRTESYIIFGSANVGNSGVIELSSLNGVTGFTINSNNYAFVSSAGNINGDEFEDFIVTSRFDRLVYVVFGSREIGSSGTFDLAALNQENGFIVNRIDEYAIALPNSVGDINQDGFDDIALGTAGKVYILFGNAEIGNSGTIDLSSLNEQSGLIINGIEGTDDNDNTVSIYKSFSVSSAGDINNDGVDDIIIGVPFDNPDGRENAGKTYIVFGSSNLNNSETIELSSLNGEIGFVINGIDGIVNENFFTINDQPGFSVSSVGDVNGDHIDDIIIGAPYADPDGRQDAGEIYLIFGRSNIGNSGILELSSLDGENGFILNGIDGGGIDFFSYSGADRFGYSLSGLGDIDGDDLEDMIIGAPYADPNGKDEAGESYVIFGSTFANNDPFRTIELYKLRNINFDKGTYNFVGAAEKDAILANENFSRTFQLEGVQSDGTIEPAFTASLDSGEGLIPFYRIRNLQTPSTYLFVSTEEYGAVFAPNSQQKDNWVKEGLDDAGNDMAEFYLYGVGSGKGREFNRFQNTQNNTFLYADEEETSMIENNPDFADLFLNQGGAFESFD